MSYTICALSGLLCAFSSFANTAPSLPPYLQTSPAPALAENTITALTHYLTRYHSEASQPWPTLRSSHLLKKGMTQPVIAAIRERLVQLGDLATPFAPASDLFDPDLKEAVQHFQQRMGLNPDGVIGAATLREINVSPASRIRQIEVNIERWKALAPSMGTRFVLVNVPDFRLFLYDNGQSILTMKAIVGKPSRPTPDITSEITHVIFNPYWNVPRLIAGKDIIPKVLNDPDYLNDMHIRIFESQEPNAREIPENEVNWEAASENGFPWHFRQEPGNDNALGRVKFEFKNSDSIYLHDTPTKNLFDLPVRDFSSGCIRLEKPLALVADLMPFDEKWTEARMQTLLDNGKTAYVKIQQPTPVIITYLTAWVDDQGQLNFRRDIYHRDQPEPAQLNLTMPQEDAETDQETDQAADEES